MRNQKLWLSMTAPLFFTATLSALAVPTPDQTYRVINGDTLSQIAETHYGNWVKWHELWNWNKEIIPNPDLIYPGQNLRLENSPHLIGQSDLQLVSDNSDLNNANGSANPSANDGSTPRRKYSKISEEWRLLPMQQWEIYVFPKASEVDPMGFDRRSRVAKKIADKTSLSETIASDRIAIQGEIINSRNEYTDIYLGDSVFIKADEQLQVGTTYSITNGPEKVTSARDGRVGFIYDLLGKVRIVGVRDNLFIGTVILLRQPIERHQLLIPEVPTIIYPPAVAAPSALDASVIVAKSSVFALIGEQQTIFIDRGSDDGIKPGMVFRHYLHNDPLTGEEISSKDFLIESQLLVIDVKDKFSSAVVTNSRNLLHPNDDISAVTDLSNVDKHPGMETGILDKPTSTTNSGSLDELDRLDQTEGVGTKEDQELRQLENFSKPVPGATLQTPNLDEEIKKDTIVRPNHSAPVSIGNEAAPNDGSNLKPPAEAVPETAPAPTEPNTPAKQDSVLDSSANPSAAPNSGAPTTDPNAVTPPPQNAQPAPPPAAPPENAPPPLMGDPPSTTDAPAPPSQ